MSFDVFNSMTLCDNTQFDNFFTVPQKYKKKVAQTLGQFNSLL